MSLPAMLKMPNDTRKLPPPSRLSLHSALEDQRGCAKKLPNSCRLIFAFTIAQTADYESSPYPVSTPWNCLLREDISIPPAICFKAVADVLLLLHVHVVKLVDWDRIGRTRSAGREGSGGTLRRASARAMRWVHVSCVGTKRQVWSADVICLAAFWAELSAEFQRCRKP